MYMNVNMYILLIEGCIIFFPREGLPMADAAVNFNRSRRIKEYPLWMTRNVAAWCFDPLRIHLDILQEEIVFMFVRVRYLYPIIGMSFFHATPYFN